MEHADTIYYLDLLAKGEKLLLACRKGYGKTEKWFSGDMLEMEDDDCPVIMKENRRLRLIMSADYDGQNYYCGNARSRDDYHIDMDRLQQLVSNHIYGGFSENADIVLKNSNYFTHAPEED